MLKKVEAEPRAGGSDKVDVLLAGAMLALIHPFDKTRPCLVHPYDTLDYTLANLYDHTYLVPSPYGRRGLH